MKRLIIAVCMLITGIAISIGGYVNLKSICRNMSCSVNEVIRAAENGDADETKRKCDDTEKMWDKKSPLLGVYTNHSEMDKYGVNNSLTHVDFMIGSNDMNIVGITHQGEEVQVFKDGN